MTPDKIQSLSIPREDKHRSQKSIFWIFLVVIAAAATAIFFAWPRASDQTRGPAKKSGDASSKAVVTAKAASTTSSATNSAPAENRAPSDDVVLTVSGYVIPRERIELSPRFMGTVKWIGVKKGDAVTNGQVVVLLDDSEYRARMRETEGRLASAKASLEK